MSFLNLLKEDTSILEPKTKGIPEVIYESIKSEDLLRNNGFKIKSIHGTKFGTEYIMAKKYKEEDIKAVLKDFTLKFDDKSIFVVG